MNEAVKPKNVQIEVVGGADKIAALVTAYPDTGLTPLQIRTMVLSKIQSRVDELFSIGLAQVDAGLKALSASLPPAGPINRG